MRSLHESSGELFWTPGYQDTDQDTRIQTRIPVWLMWILAAAPEQETTADRTL